MATATLSSISLKLSKTSPQSTFPARNIVSCASANTPALLMRPLAVAITSGVPSKASTSLASSDTSSKMPSKIISDNFNMVSSPSFEMLRSESYALVSSPSLEILKRADKLNKGHGSIDHAHYTPSNFEFELTSPIDETNADRSKSKQANEAIESVRKGGLISNEVMSSLLRYRLSCVSDGRAWILDGYPRTPEQVQTLFSIKADLSSPSCEGQESVQDLIFVQMIADDECVRERIEFRRMTSTVLRVDDASDTVIEKRLCTYREQLPGILLALREHDALTINVDATEGKQKTFENCIAGLHKANRSGKRTNVVLIGPPGVGKGTLATQLSNELSAEHVSTGELVRKAMDDGTDSVGEGSIAPPNASKFDEKEIYLKKNAEIECFQESLLIPSPFVGFA